MKIMFIILESIQICCKSLIAVPMVAIGVHKCHGNIGTLFKKLLKGSVRLIYTFKRTLFNLFKFFILISYLKQIEKVLFVDWGKLNHIYFITLHISLSTFCFFSGDISWIRMKSIILGSKTINQNIYEQNASPNEKIFNPNQGEVGWG